MSNPIRLEICPQPSDQNAENNPSNSQTMQKQQIPNASFRKAVDLLEVPPENNIDEFLSIDFSKYNFFPDELVILRILLNYKLIANVKITSKTSPHLFIFY